MIIFGISGISQKHFHKHWFGANITQRLNDLAKSRKGILRPGLKLEVLASPSLSVLPTKISRVSCFSDVQLQELWCVLLCRGVSLRLEQCQEELPVLITCP